ncbi:MAG: type III-B CRISPR module-associated protein Cmr5 [Candidatus Binatia bacterium]|nr:type III-B CRISPR module-associated protein Cmr5 [Candidatus Binatia bacterium]
MPEKAKHIEQERAQWALETVRELQKQVGKKDELLSHIRKLPSHIQTSGLAQTLLFYGQKQPAIAEALVRHLQLDANGNADIAHAVSELVRSAARVRQKTRDALNAAQWLKRFAEVELK